VLQLSQLKVAAGMWYFLRSGFVALPLMLAGLPAVSADEYFDKQKQAAEQGEVTAQVSLGSMYYMGLGVPQDYAEAAKWYRLIFFVQFFFSIFIGCYF